MVGEWPVFLISHGSFAQGALECIEVLAGKQENVEVLSVFLESNVNKLREDLDALYKTCNQGAGVLILVDMVGGTPWNLAVYLALSKKDVVVYAGFNISVLLEVFSNRKLPLDAIGEIIEKIHVQSCVNAEELLKEQEEGINNVN
jgi:PTS system mannose-specific IIA component